ncbi:MAG TPA: hypothetical protein VGM70_09170 [Pseudolysinimonas sp.]|jgi:hypothetical protein
MSQISTTRHARRAHRQPLCEQSNKRRYRDGKDARLALREAARLRSVAAIAGLQCGWVVTRAYRCEDCQGWHLTSSPARRLQVAA